MTDLPELLFCFLSFAKAGLGTQLLEPELLALRLPEFGGASTNGTDKVWCAATLAFSAGDAGLGVSPGTPEMTVGGWEEIWRHLLGKEATSPFMASWVYSSVWVIAG